MVVLEYPMLYTKFQCHRPLGSEEELFFNCFSIYGPGIDLGHVTLNIWTRIFISLSHLGSIVNSASNGLGVFWGKKFENVESECQWMALTLGCHVLIYLTIWTNFHLTGFNSFLEIYRFFQYTNKRDQFWPCCKIGQGKPRFIIWIYLGSTCVTNVHTKFQGHRPFGSREEDF